jgi:hypothetical protein
MRKYLILLFLLLLPEALGLAISGQSMKIVITHEPGYVREDTFYITNREGYTSTYDIFPTIDTGTISPEYFKVIPNRIEGVKDSESRSFKVRVELPEVIESPGYNEVLVKAKIDLSSEGGIRAVPSVAIKYIIFVLYPTKYFEWTLATPNLNVNESKDFTVSVRNLGRPTLDNSKASIEIFDSNDVLITTLDTQAGSDTKSWETAELKARFNSFGLKSGDYKAVATLETDGNISTKENIFRIGTKNVLLHDFTKLFEHESINKMDISIESAWNSELKEIQADIEVYDLESGNILKKFKSFPSTLQPWETRNLEAYFDTRGLEKKDYRAVVILHYEGLTTAKEQTITIGENINAVVVEEIPGAITFKTLAGMMTPMNLLMLLILIFLVVNVVLVAGILKKKTKKDVLVDEAVVRQVLHLISQYKDEYIQELMIKKGWKEEQVRIILAEANKRKKNEKV